MPKPAKRNAFRTRAEGIALWREKNPDHIPARERQLFPPARSNRLADRAIATVWPWRQREYPGIARLRAWLVGVQLVQTGDDYRDNLPASRAAIMADRLETIAARVAAVVIELRAYAAGAPVPPVPKAPKVAPPVE